MLELALVSSFDVASFNGTKSVVLTTTSPLGNLQESVAIPCFIIGGCSLLVAWLWMVVRRAPCSHGPGPCRFERLLANRLSTKQRRTMGLTSMKKIKNAIF